MDEKGARVGIACCLHGESMRVNAVAIVLHTSTGRGEANTKVITRVCNATCTSARTRERANASGTNRSEIVLSQRMKQQPLKLVGEINRRILYVKMEKSFKSAARERAG